MNKKWAYLLFCICVVLLWISAMVSIELMHQHARKVKAVAITKQTAEHKHMSKQKDYETMLKHAKIAQLEPEADVDNQIEEKIEAATESNDYEALKNLMPIIASKSEEVKESMIDALAQFERKALPELIMFLGDSSTWIKEKAFDEVNTILGDGEDIEIAEDVALIMKSTAVQSDTEMEDIAMNLSMINDNIVIVTAVIDIMENGQSELGKKWADDTYNFTTGEHYTGKADAMKWIQENLDE